MPAESLIIGVDLAPIKPIPRTITFQGDITSDKCRATIRQHLKTWKADTVLHDGAPNVGTAWVQDAFSQAELALQAMKLATDFLKEGGTFITKVFRSKDYNPLLWVFKQLFTKVEATKPPSSRTVSAEIFVVCRGFKAPKRIDPNFLDPRSVFAELKDPKPNYEAKVFNPEKKKRKRDGYEAGNYTQFKEITASDFILGDDPIAILGSFNKLSFEQNLKSDIALAALEQMAETTPEIKHCCADLKVLGRKDFRILLRWRMTMRRRFGLGIPDEADVAVDKELTDVEPMDDELRVQEELQALSDNKISRKKRERRRENERKQRETVRMQMHMLPATEIGLEQAGPMGEDSVFSLGQAGRKSLSGNSIQKFGPNNYRQEDSEEDQNSQSSEAETDVGEDSLDRELEELYGQYLSHKMNSYEKPKAKRPRVEASDEDWTGCSETDGSESDGSGYEEIVSSGSIDQKLTHRVLGILPSVAGNKGLSQRATSFFDQDIFTDINSLHGVEPRDSTSDMSEDGANTKFAKTLFTKTEMVPLQARSESVMEYMGSDDVVKLSESQKIPTKDLICDSHVDENGFTASVVEQEDFSIQNRKVRPTGRDRAGK